MSATSRGQRSAPTPTTGPGARSTGASAPPTGAGAPDAGPRPGERHLAPIRWPKPTAHGAGWLAVWALGIAVGIVVPAFIVPPTAASPADGTVLEAFGVTVLGVVIMVLAAIALYRRSREGGLLVFAFVPSAAVLAGGFILMGVKLAG